MKKSNNGRLIADPIDTLRDDILAIKRDLASLLGTGVDAVTDRAIEVAEHAGESIKERAARTRQQAFAAHQRLAKVAGARPIATIALAAAAGAIAANLVGRMLRD